MPINDAIIKDQCPICETWFAAGIAGQWFQDIDLFLCTRCIREGSTEGFTPWKGDKIAAHLAASGLPPFQRNAKGFLLLPGNLV